MAGTCGNGAAHRTGGIRNVACCCPAVGYEAPKIRCSGRKSRDTRYISCRLEPVSVRRGFMNLTRLFWVDACASALKRC